MRNVLRLPLVLATLVVAVLGIIQPAEAQRVDQLPMLQMQKQMQQRTSPRTQKTEPSQLSAAASMQAPAEPPAAPISPAPTDSGIAVVVNDNVITTTDIDNRMRIAFLSANLPDVPEVRQRLLPQIVRSLIDEQLELQEAKRLDISISKDEIESTERHIADENHIPGDMVTFLKQHNISSASLEAQIRAGLAWAKVVQRELRPRVEVGDDEVQSAMERIRANAGKEEYLTSEIFLAVDNPKDEDQVRQFADNLVQQLKSGTRFSAIARQFSQGAGAASGGDIGWIQEGQLPPDLNKAIVGIGAPAITEPIRTSNGYHIMGVREKRTVSLGDPKDIILNLQQAFHPVHAASEKDQLLSQAADIRKTVTSCDMLKSRLSSKFPEWAWQNMGDVKLDKAPEWLRTNVQDLKVGTGGAPIATDKGALIIFLCGKREPDNAANREAITSSIGTEKLELQARRLLRDLRRNAYLDIRLPHDQP